MPTKADPRPSELKALPNDWAKAWQPSASELDAAAPRPGRAEALRAAFLDRQVVNASGAPSSRRPSPRRWRWALGGLLLAGACALPTELEVPLGVGLGLELAAHSPLDARELVQELESMAEAEEVQVRLMLDEQTQHLSFKMWGSGLSPQAVESHLRAEYPQLPASAIETEALDGRVPMIAGRRVLHELLAAPLGSEQLAQARKELELELAAQGLAAMVDGPLGTIEGEIDVEVQVDEPGGTETRKVEVRVRQRP